MTYTIQGEFLKEAKQFFAQLPEITEQAAALALNQVGERQALPMIRRNAESQINFPKGYLNEDRLHISRKATRTSLEVVITARDRPTSLARFAPGSTPANTRHGGVVVQVKGGRSRHLRRAFLVNLRSGNIGLATRDKRLISRAHKPVQLGRGVYLLYGPSVDQVVRTSADEVLPKIGDQLSREFLRQFTRLSRG